MQLCVEHRAEKGAGILLGDDDVAIRGHEFAGEIAQWIAGVETGQRRQFVIEEPAVARLIARDLFDARKDDRTPRLPCSAVQLHSTSAHGIDIGKQWRFTIKIRPGKINQQQGGRRAGVQAAAKPCLRIIAVEIACVADKSLRSILKSLCFYTTQIAICIQNQ